MEGFEQRNNHILTRFRGMAVLSMFCRRAAMHTGSPVRRVRNTRAGSYSHLQGIFLAQGSNPGLLHYRQTLYHLSHKSDFRSRNTENSLQSSVQDSAFSLTRAQVQSLVRDLRSCKQPKIKTQQLKKIFKENAPCILQTITGHLLSRYLQRP